MRNRHRSHCRGSGNFRAAGPGVGARAAERVAAKLGGVFENSKAESKARV